MKITQRLAKLEQAAGSGSLAIVKQNDAGDWLDPQTNTPLSRKERADLKARHPIILIWDLPTLTR